MDSQLCGLSTLSAVWRCTRRETPAATGSGLCFLLHGSSLGSPGQVICGSIGQVVQENKESFK